MASNSGVLYVVATPIGNLGDISQRALEVLQQVDLIAAEDTRNAKKLLGLLGLNKACIAYHEHNEDKVLPKIKQRLLEGESIALISDAGTPLISDPGYGLVRSVQNESISVIPVPGASAVITALSVSGLPTDRFTFEGFLPAKTGARRKQLEVLVNEQRTLVFYESCHRIVDCLNDMEKIFGPDRRVTVCRELTKKFETIHQDKLDNLCDWIQQSNQQKGEFVLVVEGSKADTDDTAVEATQILKTLLNYLSPSQAAAATAQMTGLKKKPLYQQALSIQENK